MSPEFRLRPSLSVFEAHPRMYPARVPGRVAGVQTPAFVERYAEAPSRPSARHERVAGVQTPAFVERDSISTCYQREGKVSPEFRLPAFVERA